LLILPLVLISANALRVRNCDYATGLAFFALLPVVSVACATATGFVCARMLRRPALGAWLVILASMVWGLVRFYRTPAIFGFDPLVGYFAGTLYDEDLSIPTALYFARAMHLLFAGGALALVLHRRRTGLIALALGSAIFLARGPLAIAPDASDIARALGG